MAEVLAFLDGEEANAFGKSLGWKSTTKIATTSVKMMIANMRFKVFFKTNYFSVNCEDFENAQPSHLLSFLKKAWYAFLANQKVAAETVAMTRNICIRRKFCKQ